MARLIVSSVASTLSVVFLLSTAACSGGEIAVGKTNQQLKTKRDGTPTGDGTSCSWEGTPDVSAGTSSPEVPVTSTGSPGEGDSAGYVVGADFKAPDGCNDCECTARGIMCTMRACATPPGSGSSGGTCNAAARLCKDGAIAKAGPGCSQICPEDPVACSKDAKQCPDGTYVSRTGPTCEFAPCSGGAAEPPSCPADAKLCPDGKTSVTRTGPSCAFAACPQ